jgi:DNA polymerase-1
MGTLLVIDGHAYAYRAFHAIPALNAPGGAPVNAIFGFIKMLGKMRAAVQPASIVVVWDGGLSDKRTLALPLYKANRPPMPDTLGTQIEEIKTYLSAVRVLSLCEDGVEADDTIGSIAVNVAGVSQRVVIASSDKDFMQLVSGSVVLLNPADKNLSLMGEAEVLKKTGVAPHQIVDWLSLIGDTVDNIPGVPGVGPKTATSLLNQFESIDGIYAGLGGALTERLRKALLEHRDAVYRNRDLIRLEIGLPIPTLGAMMACQPDVARSAELYSRWGFRSLLAELEQGLAAQPDLI